jgi:hypothetical protein
MGFNFKNIFRKPKRFSEPGNTSVYTTIHVMKEGSLITLVSHELDGDWQFMGDEPINDYSQIAMVVSLNEIVKHDKTVLEVSDMPLGYRATRSNKSEKWLIEKIDYSDSEIEEMGYYCGVCGKYHREIPMNYGAEAPSAYAALDEDSLKNTELTQDLCVIDQNRFFIKGRIKIPVEGKEEPFSWNVWVEISKDDFEREQELWDDENRFLNPPYSGILNTPLYVYPDTLGLKVSVQTQKVGLIPDITIVESDHPLFLEQENGIKMERVISFAKEILYRHD